MRLKMDMNKLFNFYWKKETQMLMLKQRFFLFLFWMRKRKNEKMDWTWFPKKIYFSLLFFISFIFYFQEKRTNHTLLLMAAYYFFSFKNIFLKWKRDFCDWKKIQTFFIFIPFYNNPFFVLNIFKFFFFFF